MISCLCIWPSGFDYPLFRDKLNELSTYVEDIVICFTSHGNYNLKPWLRENIHGVRFLDSDTFSHHPGDWRNKATNMMIDYAQGDTLLFLEQDFLIESYPHFFPIVKNAGSLVTFEEGERFHPAFLLVDKSLSLKTSRNFSALEQGQDHFWLFSQELKVLATPRFLPDLGLIEGKDWKHLRGVTENYFASKPYYDLPAFREYNEACQKITPMSDYWKEEMERCQQI